MYKQSKNGDFSLEEAKDNIPIGDTLDPVLNKAIIYAMADGFQCQFLNKPDIFPLTINIRFQLRHGQHYLSYENYITDLYTTLPPRLITQARQREVNKGVLKIIRALWANSEQIFTLKRSFWERLKFLFNPKDVSNQ